MIEKEILYESGNFWVRRELFGSGRFKPKSEGYRVYESGVTHSSLRATIGYPGTDGLKRAIEKANELAAQP